MIDFDPHYRVRPRALFLLEPRANGTWARQRLTSYVQELAITSLIKPHALRDHFGPFPFGARCREGAVDPSKAPNINGAADCARNWVSVVSELVGRTDIEGLTLLPFADFVRFGGGAHLHARRMWCRRCLQEDLVLGQLPYERLLWSLRQVVVCPLHGSFLDCICPHCGRSQTNELARDCLPGHCGFCQHFLGDERTDDVVESEGVASEYQLWVARDFGNLLDMNPDQIEGASHENVRLMMRLAIAKACRGRPQVFSENLRFGCETVKNWVGGWRRMSLTVISSLSWIYGVPMRAWLLGEVDAWDRCCVRELPLDIHRDSDFRTRSYWCDWDAVGARILARLESDRPPRGVTDAARLEYMTAETFKKRLPDVYRRVRDAAAERRKASGAINRSKLRERIRVCIEQLIEEGLPATRTRVATRLGRGLFPKGEKIYWEEIRRFHG
ncbi:hypothetical protein QFZ94_002051 [Paraburkholderia sp. JPY465]|uniref:hypothetical protein n=1 Tax=Paraburkholderia sp. JPY465 TaxID=3042285 RepID=UPI003D1F8D6C